MRSSIYFFYLLICFSHHFAKRLTELIPKINSVKNIISSIALLPSIFIFYLDNTTYGVKMGLNYLYWYKDCIKIFAKKAFNNTIHNYYKNSSPFYPKNKKSQVKLSQAKLNLLVILITFLNAIEHYTCLCFPYI